MRVYPATAIIIACIALSACARPVGESAVVQDITLPETVQTVANIPSKTPGQPRLSELRAVPESIETLSQEQPRPPVATFSRYDGRAPGDAIIDRSIPVRRSETPLERPQRNTPLTQESLALALAKPKPDEAPEAAFKVRKTNSVLNNSAPARVPTEVKTAEVQRSTNRSVTATPRPSRRPITASPKPIRRPSVDVAVATPTAVIPVKVQPAAPLPTPPFIRAVALPSLTAPRTSQDSTPTAVPAPLTAEIAIPLGTIPASLGAANIQAAEAALPVADSLEQSKADASGTLGWDDAMALVRAGEVDSAIDVGEFEVLMTLCSGRGVLTIQTTPGALDAINFPKVVCGKAASLTSQ